LAGNWQFRQRRCAACLRRRPFSAACVQHTITHSEDLEQGYLLLFMSHSRPASRCRCTAYYVLGRYRVYRSLLLHPPTRVRAISRRSRCKRRKTRSSLFLSINSGRYSRMIGADKCGGRVGSWFLLNFPKDG